jgi:dipeptidyl aminopeptidase/acylaminoacyl peptidase
VGVAEATGAAWEVRFRAPSSRLPAWSPSAPDRCVYASNESGAWQLHAWDAATGERRQVTDGSVGVVDGVPTLDGEGVVWFEDATGDESGHWVVQPFGGGETRDFLTGVPHGWNEGLAQAPGIVAAAISSRDGFLVYVSVDGDSARELCRSKEPVLLGGAEEGGVVLGGLSADGSLLCLGHAEHGDLIHPALRVVDPRSGETVGEQVDRGSSLHAKCWAPGRGDARLAFDHDRTGETRPGVWDLSTGERRDLEVEVDGEVTVESWWPDGSALLLNHLAAGRHALLRYELATGETTQVTDDAGVILSARVRPDGQVWLLHEQGHRQRRIVDETGNEVLQLRGAPAAPAQPYRSWEFENPHGQRVHGFYVTPDAAAPFPVVMLVHGGPTFLDLDRWQPDVQALVDAGFTVGLVNYRGSTGYGREWKDALIGDIGGPELEDVNAGLHDLVARGIADPARAVIAGFSWGGYVTLLELGKHPELWCCGIAGVPVGDYLAAYEDESPLLQAYDRALLGAPPSELPELMRDRNPINFVDQVRAPVFVLLGRNDSRCPYQQAMAYVERLVERGHPHELYVYSTGHSAFDVEERIRHMRRILDFLALHVPGVEAPA